MVNRFGFKKILVTIDGSVNSKKAATVAIDIAKKYSSHLIIVNAIASPSGLIIASEGAPPQSAVLIDQYYKNSKEYADKLIKEVIDQAKEMGIDASGEVLDKPASVVEMITNYARENNVDLIVMGTRGLSGFKKLLLGSVSNGVLNHAHCSVLVVR
ncbi:MAG: universal stress protein [Nitrososphaerota archaeon]